MHITMLALGSYGDVLPIATLGQGLQTVGHQVRLITFENFAGLADQHGLDFHPIRGDSQAILKAGGGLALAESGQNVLRAWWAVMRSFGILAHSIAGDLSAPIVWETEAIINQLPGGIYGYDLAEKIGRPMITVAVMPLVRTAAFPMLGFPTAPSRLPGYNAFSYRVAEQSVWQWYRPAINRWRQAVLGLPKQSLGGYAGAVGTARAPILHGFSGQVVPRPADWGDHVHQTGYWFPTDRAWTPPDRLRRFIEAGPRPVFIGFGSMPVRDPAATTAIILAALKKSGRRAVLHAGWAKLGQEGLPEQVYPIDYAPYDWLFPRMAAVVDHGGSGSTAFGLRAGVPTLIVPFLFDQFYWGRRVFELGVGPKPIPQRRLSAANLAEALHQATTDPAMARRAAALGEKIGAEDGMGRALAVLERYLE